MTALSIVLLLGLVWMAVAGDFSLGGLVVGAVAAVIALALARVVFATPWRPVAFLGALVRLWAYFVYRLVVASTTLARDILIPGRTFHPAMLTFDVSDLTRGEAVLLGLIISLTPGTLTTDVDEESRTLVLHAAQLTDRDKVHAEIERFARYIKALRTSPVDRAVAGGAWT